MRGGVVFDRAWMEIARREQNMTQTQVAQACDIAISNYGRIEKGVYTPDVKTALRICDILRLNPRKFLNEKPVI